jgi:sugar fermentation stimulation protein A
VDAGLTYGQTLRNGTFLRRYKRFFADVRLEDGQEVVAHCANTGSMHGIAVPGSPCRVSMSDNPKRKLKYSLEQMCIDGDWIMVHTGRPNRIVEQAIADGRVPELAGYTEIRRERPYGTQRSRIDLLLTGEGRPDCYVEVKNVTLVQDGVAMFPDAVTSRGARHLEELAHVVGLGHRGVLFFHVARGTGAWVCPAESFDPHYAETLRAVVEAGVEVLAYRCDVGPQQLGLRERLEVRVGG